MSYQPSLFPLPPAQLDDETAADIRRLLDRCPKVKATLTIAGEVTHPRTGRKTVQSIKVEIDGDTLAALITSRLAASRPAANGTRATLSADVAGEHLEADLDDDEAANGLISRVLVSHDR